MGRITGVALDVRMRTDENSRRNAWGHKRISARAASSRFEAVSWRLEAVSSRSRAASGGSKSVSGRSWATNGMSRATDRRS